MSNLGKHLHFLNLLYNTHLDQQKALLHTSSLLQIAIICEILLNIVNGTIELNDELKKYMNKKKKIIYQLLDKKVSRKRKKNILKRNLPLLKIILQSVIGFINNEPSSSKIHTNTRGEVQADEQNVVNETK